jgi:hypothetical protein
MSRMFIFAEVTQVPVRPLPDHDQPQFWQRRIAVHVRVDKSLDVQSGRGQTANDVGANLQNY